MTTHDDDKGQEAPTPGEGFLESMDEDDTEVKSRGIIGRVVGDRFRIERCLGSGGTATVYAATHLRNGLSVAIKVLHPELAAEGDMKRRFLREGYVANRIRHPGVVRVLDDGTMPDGSVFLVMDLVEGESLAERRAKMGGKVPVEEVLAAGYRVLDALEAAHAQGIVHRDIKPDNVYFARDGGVRVLDFGLARMKEQVEAFSIESTGTGQVLGTLDYMSPEQARGDNDQVDARSDIWSLGATLYTSITGRRVFSGRTLNDYLAAVATEQAGSISIVDPALPAEVVAVVDRALQLAKADRWPSAEAMRLALRDAFPPVSRVLTG